MKFKHTISTLLCSVAVLATQAHAEDALKADVIHWWTSEGEAKAVAVFADAFNAAGGEWVDAAVAGTDAAKAAASTRIQAGDPPAAIVYNSLKDVEDLVATGQMANIDAVAASWADSMPASVVDTVSRDGHVYAVPLNLGINNYLWTSPTALAAIGESEPPKTWDEFFAMGDKLKEKDIIPLAMSGQWYWYLMILGNVLTSQGVEPFLAFHSLDTAVFDMPEYQKAIEIYARLREYSDAGFPGREWNLSNQMVMNGDAAFELMGDWVKGEILAAGGTPGVDLLCSIGPDAQIASASGDVLVFPSIDDAAEATAAQALLATVVSSSDVQNTYAAAKGSLPVRTDVDSGGFDACAQVALTALATNPSVPAYPVMLSPDAAGSIADVLSEFWVDPSMDAAELTEQLKDTFESLM